ncbi:hypothetical protein RND71_028372 [Anisodus tanguticus]|uniref:Uncharacterized protein n=1 Tax=Anisodus tanguticus TaxID=243964 RepID=A0AAE1V942_9SOLA|nr:hypothetical protein RND71_028372 [Anisodus tanguticus]
MLSFAPDYTPSGEYEELLIMHVPQCPKQTVPTCGARSRGRQGEAGNRRVRGRVDHQLVDQDDVVADREPDAPTTDKPSSSLPAVDPYYPIGALEAEDAVETQVAIAQSRSKRERRATRCGMGGHRY